MEGIRHPVSRISPTNSAEEPIFEAFFTSGKKGGTGLGLAIAKRIVEAHGGTICCTSAKTTEHPLGIVEFTFTLPTSTTYRIERSQSLPHSSGEIKQAIQTIRSCESQHDKNIEDPSDSDIEGQIVERFDAVESLTKVPMVILVVEDESIYLNGLLSLMSQSKALTDQFRMAFATNEAEALAVAKRE